MLLNNIIIAFNAVMPLFILMAIGLLTRKFSIISEEQTSKFNSFTFKVFFPFMMFNNIYSSDISHSVNPKIIYFAIGAILTVYMFAFLITVLTVKDNKKRGAVIQAVYRSNYVVLGLPIVKNIMGESAMGTAAVVAATVIPVFNILAVVTLEIFRSKTVSVKRILKELSKNPLIIGVLFGIAFVLLNIKLPDVIYKTVKDMSNVATPLSVIILGASLNISEIAKAGKEIILATIGRLILVPLFVMIMAALFGFKGADFATLLIVFASPCAISSYPMAREMGSDSSIALGTIVLSSALSVLTLFLWIFLFKQLGMF